MSYQRENVSFDRALEWLLEVVLGLTKEPSPKPHLAGPLHIVHWTYFHHYWIYIETTPAALHQKGVIYWEIIKSEASYIPWFLFKYDFWHKQWVSNPDKYICEPYMFFSLSNWRIIFSGALDLTNIDFINVFQMKSSNGSDINHAFAYNAF